jgi:ketosteroid isomerase-like protein
MFHDDGIMEFPYAPPGNPAKLGSKAEIADYMKGYPEHISVGLVSRRGVYHSEGVMVVEFNLTGTAVPTGNAFAMDYVGIIQHRTGKIEHYRDYWNPLEAMQALGASDALLATDVSEKKS